MNHIGVGEVSKSAARKAGSTLRERWRGDVEASDLVDVLSTIDAYRRSFAKPMATVSDQLSKLLAHRGIEAEVSQRLKRMSTIVEKIALRESRLDLSRMQDIGRVQSRPADRRCRPCLPSRQHHQRSLGRGGQKAF